MGLLDIVRGWHSGVSTTVMCVGEFGLSSHYEMKYDLYTNTNVLTYHSHGGEGIYAGVLLKNVVLGIMDNQLYGGDKWVILVRKESEWINK